jgi:hypothetical protein
MTPAMREADLLTGVIDLAHALGYRCAHFRPAMTARGWRTPVQADGAGFPDLVMVRPGRIVAAELKTDHGAPTAEQLHWIAVLNAAGVPAYLWRPGDYPERIAAILK